MKYLEGRTSENKCDKRYFSKGSSGSWLTNATWDKQISNTVKQCAACRLFLGLVITDQVGNIGEMLFATNMAV